MENSQITKEKYVLTAFILFLFGWSLSLHRVYAGKTKSAIIQIVFCWITLFGALIGVAMQSYIVSGLFGLLFIALIIWYVVDVFLIASQKIFDKESK